ncbi:MAG TPA: hypothetical protein VJ867_02675 [Gemmatimonadaceae bacterium]|nr:hypothetical protein [Gemmatimonadaceae bacterium]
MFAKRARRLALVGPLGDQRISVHTAGYPLEADRLLPDPDVLVVVEDKDGAMLFRYTAHGEMCGDTPHESLEQAERQAVMEYGSALMQWQDVPDDVKDVHAYAIEYASRELNSRDE